MVSLLVWVLCVYGLILGIDLFVGHLTFSSVQFSSVAQSCPTLCNLMNHSTPGLPVHHQLPEFTQTMPIELMMPSSHLILCCPLLCSISEKHALKIVCLSNTYHWLEVKWGKSVDGSIEKYTAIQLNSTQFNLTKT